MFWYAGSNEPGLEYVWCTCINYTIVFVLFWAVFCLLLRVSSGCARPITGQVTSFAFSIVIIKDINHYINTLRPRQNGRSFTDDTFKCIFLNENVRISIKISLKFVLKGPINNNPALVQIMAWRLSGDKPLSEPMMVCLLTHICVTCPQWVKFGNDLFIMTAISPRVPWVNY